MITNYRTTVEYHTWRSGFWFAVSKCDRQRNTLWDREKPGVHWLSRRVRVWSFLTPCTCLRLPATWKSRWPSYLISKQILRSHGPGFSFSRPAATPTNNRDTRWSETETTGASVCTPHRKNPWWGWTWAVAVGLSTSDLLGSQAARDSSRPLCPPDRWSWGNIGRQLPRSCDVEPNAVTLSHVGNSGQDGRGGGIIDRNGGRWGSWEFNNLDSWVRDLGKGNKRMAEEGGAGWELRTVLKKKKRLFVMAGNC